MSAVAIGPTGLSHEHTAAIELAAAWAAGERVAPSPIVPALVARFGLTTIEACEAASDAAAMRSAGQ